MRFIILAITIFLFWLVNCNKAGRYINVYFTSDKYTFDIVSLDNKIDTLNEYYALSVENSLYDTIYFDISNLGVSKIRSVLTSKIEYNKNNKTAGVSFTSNFRMPTDSIVAIPKYNKKTINFILPEYSDTTKSKSYVFLFQLDSNSVKKYRYLRISPKYGIRKCITEIY